MVSHRADSVRVLIQAVVFDIDQTLWDFHSLRRAGLAACLDLIGTRSDRRHVEAWTIDDLQDRFDEVEASTSGLQLAQARSISLQEAANDAAPDDPTLGRELSELYFQHRHGPAEPFPDVVPAIRELRAAGYKLGIVSNGNSNLERIGLAGLWDDVVLGPDHGLAKPDPAIFRLVEDRLGCRAEQTVCVGDDLDRDVRGPQEAGWRAVWNRRANEILHAGLEPDATVELLTELPSILAGW